MTDAPAMKMNSIAPWFGGKRTLASVIVQELGPHKSYWEPFCGSAAVLLAKAQVSHETVCDLHEDLINLAWVLSDPLFAAELYDLLGRVLFSESIFERSREVLRRTPPPDPPSPDVGRAYWYFIFSWMGRNGLAGTNRALTSALAVRFTTGGGSPSTRFRSAIESIPAWHYRLLNVLILRRDAFDLLQEIGDTADTAIYIDPPYLLETRSPGAAQDQGASYRYDFTSCPGSGLFGGEKQKDGHDRLATALHRFKHARVVISYYDHPRLRQLFPGFTLRPVTTHKNIANQNRRGVAGGVEAPEVLLLNGPSYAEVPA